jgi:hypothetical protein
MKKAEILQMFESLAKSQGFYGRLIRQLESIEKEDPERSAEIWVEFEKYDDPVALIMALEG